MASGYSCRLTTLSGALGGRWELRAAAGCLLLAVILTTAVELRDPLPGEPALLRWSQRAPLPAPVAHATRLLTGTELVVGAGLAWSVLAWVRGDRRAALTGAAVFVLLPVLQSGLKELVGRPRPPSTLVEVRGSATSPSYPAGHAMSGLLLWGWLAFTSSRIRSRLLRAAVRALAIAIIVMTPWANLWAGVHWPTDIAGGFLWAGSLLFAAWAALRSTPERGRTDGTPTQEGDDAT